MKQAKPQPFGGPFPELPGPLLVTCWGPAQRLAAVGPGEELGHWEVFVEVLIPPSASTATASTWPAHGAGKPRAAASPCEHYWKRAGACLGWDEPSRPLAAGCIRSGFLQHRPCRPAPQQHPKGIPGEVQAVDGVFCSLRCPGNLERNLVPRVGCICYLQKGENVL